MSTCYYQHIIWDWNGTLLDDTQAGLNAVNTMLAVRALPTITLQTYRELFSFPVQKFYRSIGFKLDTENWDAMAYEFHERFLADTTIRLHAHTLETLNFLQQSGIHQSLLSVSEQSILEALLKTFGVAHFFDNVFGVDNLYGHSKLELGRILLRHIELPPNAVLMIGDSLHDYEVAEALGIDCLLIAQGHQSYARLAQCGAPVLHDLAGVTTWLKG